MIAAYLGLVLYNIEFGFRSGPRSEKRCFFSFLKSRMGRGSELMKRFWGYFTELDAILFGSGWSAFVGIGGESMSVKLWMGNIDLVLLRFFVQICESEERGYDGFII